MDSTTTVDDATDAFAEDDLTERELCEELGLEVGDEGVIILVHRMHDEGRLHAYGDPDDPIYALTPYGAEAEGFEPMAEVAIKELRSHGWYGPTQDPPSEHAPLGYTPMCRAPEQRRKCNHLL